MEILNYIQSHSHEGNSGRIVKCFLGSSFVVPSDLSNFSIELKCDCRCRQAQASCLSLQHWWHQWSRKTIWFKIQLAILYAAPYTPIIFIVYVFVLGVDNWPVKTYNKIVYFTQYKISLPTLLPYLTCLVYLRHCPSVRPVFYL